MAADPVKTGLIASLSHPGGNITGVSFLTVELHPKRLESLTELVPSAKAIALLVNPGNPNNEPRIRSVAEAAEAKGVQLKTLKAATPSEIDAAFGLLTQVHVEALIVSTDPFLESRREQILALTARHSIPAVYGFREIAAAGGLISYGPSLTGVYRQLGAFAGRILKGEKPADLPVEQPTKFELVVNLKTAKTLGLTVPQSLLARADEVIE
jgi:ABC-type uncharacterized transport system substrate-binding protein